MHIQFQKYKNARKQISYKLIVIFLVKTLNDNIKSKTSLVHVLNSIQSIYLMIILNLRHH